MIPEVDLRISGACNEARMVRTVCSSALSAILVASATVMAEPPTAFDRTSCITSAVVGDEKYASCAFPICIEAALITIVARCSHADCENNVVSTAQFMVIFHSQPGVERLHKKETWTVKGVCMHMLCCDVLRPTYLHNTERPDSSSHASLDSTTFCKTSVPLKKATFLYLKQLIGICDSVPYLFYDHNQMGCFLQSSNHAVSCINLALSLELKGPSD